MYDLITDNDDNPGLDSNFECIINLHHKERGLIAYQICYHDQWVKKDWVSMDVFVFEPQRNFTQIIFYIIYEDAATRYQFNTTAPQEKYSLAVNPGKTHPILHLNGLAANEIRTMWRYSPCVYFWYCCS